MAEGERARKRRRDTASNAPFPLDLSLFSRAQDSDATLPTTHGSRDERHGLQQLGSARVEPTSTATVTPDRASQQHPHPPPSVSDDARSDDMETVISRWAISKRHRLESTGRLAQLDSQFELEDLATALDHHLRGQGYMHRGVPDDEKMFSALEVHALLKDAASLPDSDSGPAPHLEVLRLLAEGVALTRAAGDEANARLIEEYLHSVLGQPSVRVVDESRDFRSSVRAAEEHTGGYVAWLREDAEQGMRAYGKSYLLAQATKLDLIPGVTLAQKARLIALVDSLS
ncbi:hypothetical protein Slin15195_G030010 [Septoria linicola]|uniref:Uncharacterized protein n=1 Tax=Septoria linicola TaxID=215465 RepID=A0A9Q9EH97_9PEZI|nr:hypothetical protein Slin14017_G029030 [Septoria linicola]USW49682.1 hypothetical protein Slin15195_G030010 [Septoria linicola]